MAGFTHCRCGADALTTVNGKLYLKNKCPNADDGRGYVYHELVCQQAALLFKRVNWEVLPEDGKFRAYSGDHPSTTLFETEQAAWDALDVAMWHPSEHWSEDDGDDEQDGVVHDFDPSGDEHPDHCMCPCCDLAEGRMDGED